MKPLDPDDAELLLVGQPQLVTFSQLQLDPDSFRNKLIRVSGTLLKAPPPDCVPYSGPDIEWALVAEELRLDASGFERAISMLDDGLPMTVDGFFRLYQGPLGCGKGAEDGSAWFLEVIKVVQPNPLVASGLPPGGILPPMATTPGAPILPPGSTPSPSIQLTPGTGTPQGTPGLTPTELATATSIPTATSTAGPGTPTVTTIPTASPTAPATSQVTPTPTPAPGTPTPTPTRGTGPTTTPTSTISGYPGPGTPTATATVGGYPPFPSTTLTPSYP